MAKRFRYEVVGSNFNQWATAEAFKNGYNAAMGLKWSDKDAVKVSLLRDLQYTGYVKKPVSCYEGFVVYKTTALTEKEMKEIDKKAALKEAAEQEVTARIAAQRAAKLREFAAG